MLKRLQAALASGPLDTRVMFHGAQGSVFADVRIFEADEIGVVLQVKNKRRLHPWNSISLIEWPESLTT